MTKNNIYEILIKSIGLVLVYQIIFIVREFSGNLMMFSIQSQNHDEMKGQNIFTIYYIASILVLTLISYFLIFKTKLILNKINKNDLDDTDLNLTINKNELFNVVLKTLGFIIIIWTFPSFVIELIKYFNKENQELNTFFVQKENLIYASIKIAIGIIVIIFSNKINELTNTEKTNNCNN
jgi:hypothetical protein